MTETVISSATREVTIGFDRPFAVIGERINPTGRRRLAEEMAAGDYRRVEADALAQVEAGAHLLDVNAGVPLADEPRILRECVKLIQSLTDVPLSIDSSIVAALEAGLAAYEGKALVNSVTGEEERLESVLPLVAPARGGGRRHLERRDRDLGGPGRALRGRPPDRGAGRGPRNRAPRRGGGPPRHADRGDRGGGPRSCFRLIRRLREELKVNTTCGASNISFGLPARPALNAAFLSMAMASGLTSAITNPLEPEIMSALGAADVMMGHDRNCRAWIARHSAAGGDAVAEARARRRQGRRRGG